MITKPKPRLKQTKGYSLEPETIRLIDILAHQLDCSYSVIIDCAVKHYNDSLKEEEKKPSDIV